MKDSLLKRLEKNKSISTKIAVNAVQAAVRDELAALGNTNSTKHKKQWQDYGYPSAVRFNDLYRIWERFGIAKAGVEIPVDYGWMDNPEIKEGSELGDKVTEWELVTARFFKDQKLFKKLKGADRRNRIGEYSAFIVQVQSDVPDESDWSKPLSGVTMDKILRFIPVTQGQLRPNDKSPANSPRYPMPNTYTLQNYSDESNTNGYNNNRDSFTIHYSRVIIFAEGADDNTLNGIPVNRAGYNALIDMEKICGSGAEGFWKNVAQKLVLTSNSGRNPEKKERDAITESINDAMANFDASMMLGGMQATPLNSSMPTNYKDPFMNSLYVYSASVGIPATILIGQQTGRLASDEDGKHLAKMVNSRREGWQSEMIESVIDWLDMHLVDYNVPGEYRIEWSNLLESSQSEKIDMADKAANAVQKFNNARMQGDVAITESEFRGIFGLPAEKPEEIDSFSEDDEDLIDG